MTIYVNARAVIERDGELEREILLQIRSRPGEPERWELPGGQIDPFEPVFKALEREIAEETGLQLQLVHGQEHHVLHQGEDATVETFQPLFAYQTVEGPVDSLGFYFRCAVDGEIRQVGDGAKRPTWFRMSEVRAHYAESPDQFDWLTQAAIDRYLELSARQKLSEEEG